MSQKRDAALGPTLKESASGENKYLADDNGVPWHAPRGEKPTLAIPRMLIPEVLSLVHSTFGHLGVARTTLSVRNEYVQLAVAAKGGATVCAVMRVPPKEKEEQP